MSALIIEIRGHHPHLFAYLHYAVESAIALMADGETLNINPTPLEYENVTDRVIGHVIDVRNLYDLADDCCPEREAAQWFWSEMNPSLLYDELMSTSYEPLDLKIDNRDYFTLSLTTKKRE